MYVTKWDFESEVMSDNNFFLKLQSQIGITCILINAIKHMQYKRARFNYSMNVDSTKVEIVTFFIRTYSHLSNLLFLFD